MTPDTRIQTYWDSFKLELDVIFSPTKPPLQRLIDYFEMTYASGCDRRESGEDLRMSFCWDQVRTVKNGFDQVWRECRAFIIDAR